MMLSFDYLYCLSYVPVLFLESVHHTNFTCILIFITHVRDENFISKLLILLYTYMRIFVTLFSSLLLERDFFGVRDTFLGITLENLLWDKFVISGWRM